MTSSIIGPLSANFPINHAEKIPIVERHDIRYFPRLMELAETTLQKAVAELLERSGTNAFAVEQAYGLPEDSVRSILNGTKKLGTTLNKTQAVCAALGLELYVGPPRETGPVEQLSLDDAQYAQIPLHAAMLAAGGGYENARDQIIDQLAFRRDWLARMKPRSRRRRRAGFSVAPRRFSVALQLRAITAAKGHPRGSGQASDCTGAAALCATGTLSRHRA